MATAGVLAGIAGLGFGFVLGWVWEQLHRRRRSKRFKSGMAVRVVRTESGGIDANIKDIASASEPPRLRLVSMDRAPTSHVVGNRLTSVRFRPHTIEFDFSGVIIETEGQPIVSSGATRYSYPEEGSRDAICRLIGTTVRRMRVTESNEVQLTLDDGSELVLHPRPSSGA